ncbi:MAG: glycosyl hydrolase [Acidobacteria bacterium]|nr:glycosyl hydrolase [Acidobacteriota bacterium]MBW4044034.1 glycosyl hydrolase [Acidobacteriota bacterium]
MRLRPFVLLLTTLPALLAAQSHGPWVMQESGSSASLRGIAAVNSSVAWASGTEGTVLRTEDGGAHWRKCAVPPGAEKLDFRGVQAWDGETAVVMGSGPGELSRIYRTTDGCAHWTLVLRNPDKDGFFDGLLFLDRRKGLVIGDPVGGEIALQATHDGGQSWSRVKDAKELRALEGEAFFAASNASMAAAGQWLWIATSKGRVLRHRLPADGTDLIGSTGFRSAQAPMAGGNAAAGIFVIAFRDERNGVAVGGDYTKPDGASGTAAWTADGGEHWTAAAAGPPGYRSTVAWDKAARAWIAAGTNGSDVSYDGGRTWRRLDGPEGGGWNAISLPWIVGPQGRVAKLDQKRMPHGK